MSNHHMTSSQNHWLGRFWNWLQRQTPRRRAERQFMRKNRQKLQRLHQQALQALPGHQAVRTLIQTRQLLTPPNKNDSWKRCFITFVEVIRPLDGSFCFCPRFPHGN